MKNKPLTLQFLLASPWHFLALGFGSGLAPKAPGTFGTLAGLPLVYLMSLLPVHGQLALVIVCSLLGIYLCGVTAKHAGVHDHGGIVWDEIAGIMLTFIAIPLSLTSLVTGFLLFRLFDIVKPWPIRVADQKLGGGIGIMVDDLLAGIAALAIMHFLF